MEQTVEQSIDKQKKQRAKSENKISYKSKQKLIEHAPIIGLVFVIILFAILTEGRTLTKMNIEIIINQITLTALVAIGAVFTFSCGAFDMSVPGTLCLSAIVGALVGVRMESCAWMIVTVFIVALSINLFKGVVAAYLELPIFIVTVIFSSVLVAIGLVVMDGVSAISVGSIVNVSNMTAINVGMVVIFYTVALIIFNYTRIGKACKLQGGNPLASAQSGINPKVTVISAFLMSGIGISLAAVSTLLRTRTVTASTGASLGTDVMIAIVLGGMPLSGGPRSRISAAIVGAAIITVLNNGLNIYGVSNDIIQIVRGVIFLVVVYITSVSYRTKLLPR